MSTIPEARVGPYTVGPGHPLLLIAGPCVIETTEHAEHMARSISEIAKRFDLPFVFKASYDKANRSSIESFRGPGFDEGMRILAGVRRDVGVPVLTDVHDPEQAEAAGTFVDAVQVPAFLCRQTDLLLGAGRSGVCVNIKKGQFVAPEKMELAAEKVRSTGNQSVMLTERGTFFGYERLVNDFTGLAVMRWFAPVVFDATHSVQHPGSGGKITGGQRDFMPLLARAAVAAGIDALFMEVHDKPDAAKSDKATVWPLDQLERLLERLLDIRTAASENTI